MGGIVPTIPYYVRIAPGELLPDVNGWAPFKAIVVLAADYSTNWQNEVSDWLVESGCRYMMAWGPGCSAWDDSVDWTDMEARDFADDDSKFVMTTWHENENLESVFWYSQFCAELSYDQVKLTNAVILHISNENRDRELLNLFEQSKTLADREPD